jgi:hypothetical protein
LPSLATLAFKLERRPLTLAKLDLVASKVRLPHFLFGPYAISKRNPPVCQNRYSCQRQLLDVGNADSFVDEVIATIF